MIITLTPAARSEIERMQYAAEFPNRMVRLALVTGSCHPLSYRLSFESEENLRPDDQTLSHGTCTIAIASSDLPHLNNLHIDYAEDLVGGAFRFQNPNAAETCSCGASFVPINNTIPAIVPQSQHP